jgi:CDP-diacylglycerol--glycerol-3-phosphate 3-phosphatidyltransferase
MASIYDLKPAFQRRLRPLADRLARSGASANEVTLAGVALSLAAGVLLLVFPGARLPLLLVPLVLFARMALNAIDGMLAREHGQRSRLGAILNELGDVVSDAALYLPFALIPGGAASAVVVAVLLAVVAEMAGILGVMVGASRRYDGPMGKSDRAFVFGGIALLLGLGIEPGTWLDLVVWVMAALILVTIWNRVRRALAEAAG